MYNEERLTAPRFLTSNLRKLLTASAAKGTVVPASADFNSRVATATKCAHVGSGVGEAPNGEEQSGEQRGCGECMFMVVSVPLSSADYYVRGSVCVAVGKKVVEGYNCTRLDAHRCFWEGS